MKLENIFNDNNDNSSNIFDGFEDFSLNDYEEKEEKFEKTLDIDSLKMDSFLSKEEFNKIDDTTSTAKKKSDKKSDNSIKESFINCSVLGFITAIAGTCWLVNIVNCL